MNEGMVAFMVIMGLWAIFGAVCSISCAIFTIKHATAPWYKVAGWVMIVNIGLSILGLILR